MFHLPDGESQEIDFGDPEEALRDFALTPDGRFLVAAVSASARLYDLSSGVLSGYALIEGEEFTRDIELTDDGRFVAVEVTMGSGSVPGQYVSVPRASFVRVLDRQSTAITTVVLPE